MRKILEKYLSDEQLSMMIELNDDGSFFGMPRTFGEGISYLKGKIVGDGIVYASSSSYIEGPFDMRTPFVYYEKLNIYNIDGVNFSTEKSHGTYMGQSTKEDHDRISQNGKIIYGLIEKYEEIIKDIKSEKSKEYIIDKYELDDFNLNKKNKSK